MDPMGYWLVVVLTMLKNMKVNGKDDNPSIVENKKCLKPPTSINIGFEDLEINNNI